MKIKIPMHLLGSWLLSLTLFLAVSVPVLAQSEITDALLEAERFEQQALEPAGAITGQNSNRPMAFPDPYCEVSGFSWVETITRVVFADIDNPSSVDSTIAHEDFTGVVANVNAGETYSFAAEGDTSGSFTNYITVWIDWDQNDVFDEATERYEIGTLFASTGEDGQQAVADIEVPADALAGQTRMRVMKKYNSVPDNSCDPNSSFGQAEDYIVEVGGGGGAGGETCDAPIAVTSLPYDDAGNTADYGNNYSSGDVPPVATGAVTTGTGSTSYLNGDDVVYAYTPADDEVLNISTTNDDDWIGLWAFTGCPFTSTVGYHTATSGGTRSIDELPVTAGETYYFVISTWSPPQSTDYTIHIEKVGGGGSHAYCIPEGTNSARYIDNFSTTGGTQDVSNMGSGFSPDGYGDFYDTHNVAQAHGEDVTFEVDIEGGTAGFRIWVDWNQDGVFDTTEEVAYASTSYSANHTGSFTVPADALEGDTRMRIVSHWLSTSGDIDPCETGFTYGEFEDYKFTVGTGGGMVYCIPEGTNSARYIDNFSTTGGTQDVSNMGSGFSPDGYGDFYDTYTVAQEQGEDVAFEVDIEGGTAGFRIWVDWNQDGVFDTTEEVAYASTSYSADHTGSFTVPADALEGDTRMRIVSHWLSSSGDIDPCETGFTYGEFEDYKFTVEAGTGGGTACEQDFAFSLDDGTGNLQTLLFADDFEIDSGTTMSVEKVTFRVFNNIGEATTLTIYEDDGGLPGNIVDTFSNVTPDSQTVIGSNFGFDAYDIVFTLPTVVELDSGI